MGNCIVQYTRPGLHWAVYDDDIQRVKSLLSKKDPQVNFQNDIGETPLMLGVILKRSKPVIMSLLEAGCDVNIRDYKNRAPLTMSFSWNDRTIVHELIKHGADVDILGNEYFTSTPLFYAIGLHRSEVLCTLLYYGADISLKNRQKYTPLAFALSTFEREMVSILLDYYDDFNCVDFYDNSLLHLAVKLGNDFTLRLFAGSVNSQYLSKSEVFKTIWNKIERRILLELREPLLLNYICADMNTTDEWLECLHLMLECPIAFDLVQHCTEYLCIGMVWDRNGFFMELLLAFKRNGVGYEDRVAVISICLTLGAGVSLLDMNKALQLFGFNQELETLIYATDRSTIDTHQYSHPHLALILGWEDFQLENMIRRLCQKFLSGDSIENFNFFGFFSLPNCSKGETIACFRRWLSSNYDIFETIQAAPQLPSLLELSRNQAHSFLRQKCSVQIPYQFQEAVKSLKLPPLVMDVLRFKKPIY